MAYTTDQDWTDEAEAEAAAARRRAAGGASLGVPIVTAVLGLLVGVLGTSLWWSWAGPSSPGAAAPVVAASAPAPKSAAATPPAAPAAVVAAPPSPVVAAVAPRDNNDDAAVVAAPPSAGPASAAATGLSPEEVARRKERAFARFYKRPLGCEGNPTGDQLVECGNHYIRARREFDERWRMGSL